MPSRLGRPQLRLAIGPGEVRGYLAGTMAALGVGSKVATLGKTTR